MHTEATGGFELATAVLLHMSARFPVLRRLAVNARARTRLRRINRGRINDIDPAV